MRCWLEDRAPIVADQSKWNATVASESIILKHDHDSTMTGEDPDFDEYNDAGFDEAFADLIESLNDTENGTKRS